MKQRLTKRVAVIAGTTVLALSGGAYAVAQGGSDPADERKAFLNDAAKRLDVSPEELTKALREAAAARLDEAVKQGRLTQEQADELKQHLERGGGVPFIGPGRGGPGGPHGGFLFRRGGPPPGMEAAAKYLGLTDAQLRRQLMSDKSLADLAEARNKSVDGLKDAMKTAIEADVKKAVEDKKLTQERADRILEDLDERIDDKVERTGGPGKARRMHGHGPPGFGPPPGGDATPVPPPGDADPEDG